MRRPLLLIALLCFLLAGCQSCGKPSAASERLAVTVSIFPVYDLVRRVAGPDADVTLIVPVGKTEHGYEPSAKDKEAASHARVVVMVGLGLDTWMEKLAPGDPRILKVGDRVPTLAPNDDAESVDADPHVWLDAERARLIVRAVAEELGRVDAKHAIAYRTRATELDTTLAALDKEIETRTLALTTRGFVSMHPAFAYFAERYKLEVVGSVEQTPGTPPTDAARAKLAQTIKEKKVTALFTEPQLDPAPVKSLSGETKLPLGVLDPLGGSAETDSYEKLLRSDVAALEKYLK